MEVLLLLRTGASSPLTRARLPRKIHLNVYVELEQSSQNRAVVVEDWKNVVALGQGLVLLAKKCGRSGRQK